MSAPFAVLLFPHAIRDMKGLASTELERLRDSMREIANDADPRRSTNTKKLQGRGNVYSKRVGNFRILFEIDDAKREIHILRAGDRKDIYKHP